MRKFSIAFLFLCLTTTVLFGQDPKTEDANNLQAEQKPATTSEAKTNQKIDASDIDLKKGLKTGVQVGEFSILVYSGLGGRNALSQIRKSTVEIGKIKTYKPDGTVVNSEYELRILRSPKLADEKIRIDQKFPDAKFALVYDNDKVFGIYNKARFTPREDAVADFRARIWHGPEALLRYKENGSTITLDGEETILGVTFYVVTVTDKMDRKTTFYVSKKTLRMMMLTYEEDGVKYKRKFYDHNFPQGTLVPYRSVLWADGKVIEERDISTITFGQQIDDTIFIEPKG